MNIWVDEIDGTWGVEDTLICVQGTTDEALALDTMSKDERIAWATDRHAAQVAALMHA